MSNYYPKSRVEVRGLAARYYDALIDVITFGKYSLFIEKVIELMRIKSTDRILDLGTGTGGNACLMMRHLSKEGELVEIDISQDNESITKEKIKMKFFIYNSPAFKTYLKEIGI